MPKVEPGILPAVQLDGFCLGAGTGLPRPFFPLVPVVEGLDPLCQALLLQPIHVLPADPELPCGVPGGHAAVQGLFDYRFDVAAAYVVHNDSPSI